jgi:hypothetical protein
VLDGAWFFATTIISTIGYGSFSPVTDSAKIFIMFYAIIGIGLFGAFAMASGRRALAMYRVLVVNNLQCCRNCSSKEVQLMNRLNQCRLHKTGTGNGWDTHALSRHFDEFAEREEGKQHTLNEMQLVAAIASLSISPDDVNIHELFEENVTDGDDRLTFEQAADALDKLVTVSDSDARIIEAIQILKFASVLLLIVIFPIAWFFFEASKMEGSNWTFLDSVYYVFISASTIGLGDFSPPVPSDESNFMSGTLGITEVDPQVQGRVMMYQGESRFDPAAYSLRTLVTLDADQPYICFVLCRLPILCRYTAARSAVDHYWRHAGSCRGSHAAPSRRQQISKVWESNKKASLCHVWKS